jgi:hypothetical protein
MPAHIRVDRCLLSQRVDLVAFTARVTATALHNRSIDLPAPELHHPIPATDRADQPLPCTPGADMEGAGSRESVAFLAEGMDLTQRIAAPVEHHASGGASASTVRADHSPVFGQLHSLAREDPVRLTRRQRTAWPPHSVVGTRPLYGSGPPHVPG